MVDYNPCESKEPTIAPTSRTMLITGATAGLGYALARAYAARPGHLIVHGRNPDKLRALEDELSDSQARVTTVTADLSGLGGVDTLVDAVNHATDSLDVLVNNAGIGPGGSDERQESADDFELRLAVNHIAPFALTLRLLPLLRAAAPARVVNVASAAQTPVDLDDPQLTRGYTGSRAYAQSKFAMIATGFHLARLLPADTVTVNSLHPASLMPTFLVAESYGTTIDSLDDGVRSTTRLIDDPDLAGRTGLYFDQLREASALPEAHDEDVQQRLWDLSETWSGVSL